MAEDDQQQQADGSSQPQQSAKHSLDKKLIEPYIPLHLRGTRERHPWQTNRLIQPIAIARVPQQSILNEIAESITQCLVVD